MALHETRPCWTCAHCGSMVCEEAAGVRVLGQADPDRVCPICHVSLMHAILDGKDRIDVCRRCQGILMPRETFAKTIIARRRAASARATPLPPADPRDLDRRISCPACRQTMVTDWYYGGGNTVLDTCPSCDLAWLDAGEMKRIVSAPGPDRPA